MASELNSIRRSSNPLSSLHLRTIIRGALDRWSNRLQLAAIKLRGASGAPLRAALYVRHSRSAGADRFERQLSSVREYAVSLGADISRIYVDIPNRPRTPLDDIAMAADRHEFDVLVIEDIDRLTRNWGKFLRLIARGVKIHTVRGPCQFHRDYVAVGRPQQNDL